MFSFVRSFVGDERRQEKKDTESTYQGLGAVLLDRVTDNGNASSQSDLATDKHSCHHRQAKEECRLKTGADQGHGSGLKVEKDRCEGKREDETTETSRTSEPLDRRQEE